MKLTIFTILLCSLVTVEANFIVQILFNNGDPYQCSSSEWSQLEYQIYVMSQKQRMRSLRGGEGEDITMEAVTVEEGHEVAAVDDEDSAPQRELAYPNYCANNCAGQAPRRCMAVNCVGYRKRSLVEEMTRSLFWATDCNNQISELNNLINNMRNTAGFSQGCRQFLEQQRTYNCFTNAYC